MRDSQTHPHQPATYVPGVPAAPRRLGIAWVLTVLMPGLGHIYCGRVRTGLFIWASVLSVSVIGVVLWARWLFVPVLPLLVLLLSWMMLQWILFRDLAGLIRAVGRSYRLGPINHWLAYLTIGLGLGVLPVMVTIGVINRLWVGSVQVQTQAMFPGLLPGDRVLYDRDAYVLHPPQIGDLVVVDWAGTGQLIARVVAQGGQTVHLQEGRLIVDGLEITGDPVKQMRVQQFNDLDTAHLDGLLGFLEYGYVVTFERGRPIRPEPAPVILKAEEVYVVGDSRDAALRDRLYGRVPWTKILGKPRYIWVSFDQRGQTRTGRMGLEVHGLNLFDR